MFRRQVRMQTELLRGLDRQAQNQICACLATPASFLDAYALKFKKDDVRFEQFFIEAPRGLVVVRLVLREGCSGTQWESPSMDVRHIFYQDADAYASPLSGVIAVACLDVYMQRAQPILQL
ncbi:hypothetical protein A9R05_39900 (plasmid) [Burkholderia sp. KK1]|nr:hypothetical protein A9R05_39900 [Burkholderia sp. KK1]